MIATTTNHEPTFLSGIPEAPIAMGISQDADDQLMIMNILANTLYTDKIAAVIREYGCNAADANTEAGRPEEPISVHLPNQLEPNFSVRDFGNGMTTEEIGSVFCRLGRSTKRSSNDYTGMLGIGSKAGFAYGDSFVVTSFTRGTMAVYNCFRDNGMPKLSKMHEGPTDEPDGIKVTVPVRVADISTFRNTATRVFFHFKVCPKFSGGACDLAQPVHSGNGWRYYHERGSHAVMGNVGYKIDMSQFPIETRSVLELGVDIDFEIGELEVASSREGLQYTEHVKAVLQKRINEVGGEMAKIFTSRIASQPTYWQAISEYHELFERRGSMQERAIRSLVSGKVEWNGTKITEGYVRLDDVTGAHAVEFARRYGGKYRKNPICTYMRPSTHLVVINDLQRNAVSVGRVKRFLQDYPVQTAMTVLSFESNAVRDKYWKVNMLEGAPTILLSSIEPVKAPASQRAASAKVGGRAFTFNPKTSHPTASSHWDKVKVDYKLGSGVYVEIEKFIPVGWGLKDLGAEISRLNAAGISVGLVHGLRAKEVEKLGPGWVRLTAFITDQVTKVMEEKGQKVANMRSLLAHESILTGDMAGRFPSGSVMTEYLDALVAAYRPGLSPLLDLASRYNLPLPPPTYDLDAMKEATLDTYPLLRAIGFVEKKMLTALVEYVNLIGK